MLELEREVRERIGLERERIGLEREILGADASRIIILNHFLFIFLTYLRIPCVMAVGYLPLKLPFSPSIFSFN